MEGGCQRWLKRKYWSWSIHYDHALLILRREELILVSMQMVQCNDSENFMLKFQGWKTPKFQMCQGWAFPKKEVAWKKLCNLNVKGSMEIFFETNPWSHYLEANGHRVMPECKGCMHSHENKNEKNKSKNKYLEINVSQDDKSREDEEAHVYIISFSFLLFYFKFQEIP